MSNIMTPGKRIGLLCERKGITKKELAEKIGVSPSQISRIVKEDTKTISSDLLVALATEFEVSSDYILGIDQISTTASPVEQYIPMLIMNTPFKPGTCLDFINSLTDSDAKNMAYAEYCYFSGQHDKAAEITELYLNSENKFMHLSACLIYAFANLSLNRINSARMGLNNLTKQLEKLPSDNDESKALILLFTKTANTLLHLPTDSISDISISLNELPQGMRLWGCYILAHEAYLNQEY